MKTLILALVVTALSGCSASPPKPPSCDGAAKRPVNQGQHSSAANLQSYLNCV